MLQSVNIVLVEHRQGRCDVTNPIVAGVQRLRPQEIAGGRQKRRVAETGHLRHLPKAHIGAHGDNAGKNKARIGLLFHVTPQNMGEGAQKTCLSGDEPQQVGDADAGQLPVERTVRGNDGAGECVSGRSCPPAWAKSGPDRCSRG